MAKTIFAVFASDNPAALGSVVAQRFPTDNLMVAPGQWLIAAEGTAQTVSELLGIVPPQGAIVASISSYWGAKPPLIWDWIKTKWGSA